MGHRKQNSIRMHSHFMREVFSNVKKYFAFKQEYICLMYIHKIGKKHFLYFFFSFFALLPSKIKLNCLFTTIFSKGCFRWHIKEIKSAYSDKYHQSSRLHFTLNIQGNNILLCLKLQAPKSLKVSLARAFQCVHFANDHNIRSGISSARNWARTPCYLCSSHYNVLNCSSFSVNIITICLLLASMKKDVMYTYLFCAG